MVKSRIRTLILMALVLPFMIVGTLFGAVFDFESPLFIPDKSIVGLDGRALVATSLYQNQGEVDFQGFDPSLTHDLIVKNGSKNTSPKQWTIAAMGVVVVTAMFAKLGNGSALSVSGKAFKSEDAGGNSDFMEAPSSLLITESASIKAFSRLGLETSDTVSVNHARKYTEALSPPQAFPKGGVFRDSVIVNLLLPASASLGSIYFRKGGKGFFKYEAPILLNKSEKLEAFLVLGIHVSDTVTWDFTRGLNAPGVSIPSGIFSQPIKIDLSSNNPNADVYYSVDGSVPGPESGRPPYQSPFVLYSNAILKAVSVAGSGLDLQRSEVIVETYTFTPLSEMFLGPDQSFVFSKDITLRNMTTDSTSIKVKPIAIDSLHFLKGFMDIGLHFEISHANTFTDFIEIVFVSRNRGQRGLYSIGPNKEIRFVSNQDSLILIKPGSYFTAIDTLPPAITYSGERFNRLDSTQVLFNIQDNISNLNLDVDRSDCMEYGFQALAIKSPMILKVSLKNPLGPIKPLTLKINVDDHSQSSQFPLDGSQYFASQKISSASRSPAVFKVGHDPLKPWDFISIPLFLNSPLNMDQLRTYNSTPSFEGATYNTLTGQYRLLTDFESLPIGRAIWIAGRTKLNQLVFPNLQTEPQMINGGYKITLHSGWNQVGNPTLTTLYWPFSRALSVNYDASLVKGLHGWNNETSDWIHSDSLVPWQGYFVYYYGVSDTLIELLSSSLPKKARKIHAQTDRSAQLKFGFSLIFQFVHGLSLRLGASPSASNGLGVEDESRPPSKSNEGISFCSLRNRLKLETDIQHWNIESIFDWTIVVGLPTSLENAREPFDPSIIKLERLIGEQNLPEGFSLWGVSRRRGLRFDLGSDTGKSLSMVPGFMDTIDILTGPSALLEAKLKAFPLSIPNLSIWLTAASNSISLHIQIPFSIKISSTIWSMQGRVLETGKFDFPEGNFQVALNQKGHVYGPGIYFVVLHWRGHATKGTLTQKVLVP